MQLTYRIARFVFVTVIAFLVLFTVVTYVALSLTGVQNRVASHTEKALSELLGAQVEIGGLGIVPFNRVVLRDVAVITAPGDTALTVRRLAAGFSLWDLLSDDLMTVNSAELIGMDARIWRDSVSSPLNIQPVIDALSPKGPKKEPARFNLRVQTVIIRSGSVAYEVKSAPEKEGFDPNRCRIRNLRADIRLPLIANNDFSADIKRLAFSERSGFRLEDLHGTFHLSDNEMSVSGLALKLPNSSLVIGDISLPLEGISSIGNALRSQRLSLTVAPGSNVRLSDLRAFLPPLGKLDTDVEFRRFTVEGNAASSSVDLSLAADDRLRFTAKGEATDLLSKSLSYSFPEIHLAAPAADALTVAGAFTSLKPAAEKMIASLGNIDFNCDVAGTLETFDAVAELEVAQGAVSMSAKGELGGGRLASCEAEVATDGLFDLGLLLGKSDLGGVECEAAATLRRRGNGNGYAGTASAEVEHLTFRGHTYSDLTVEGDIDGNSYSCRLSSSDPSLSLTAEAAYDGNSAEKEIFAKVGIDRFCPSELNLTDRFPAHSLSGNLDVELAGDRLNNMEGHISLADILFAPPQGEGLQLKRFDLTAVHLDSDDIRVKVNSDLLDGTMTGRFDFKHIGPMVMEVVSYVFPALLSERDLERIRLADIAEERSADINDFSFDFRVNPTEELAKFFKLPVSVIYPLDLSGRVSRPSRMLAVTLDAPYLRQGNKLIENSRLKAVVDGNARLASLDFTTTAPTKNGPMTVVIDGDGTQNRLNTDISWKIDRARAYEGNLSASANFFRAAEDAGVATEVSLHRSELTFNDSTWTVNPATVTVMGKHIEVDGLNVHRSNQFVKIDGTVSESSLDLLTLDLKNFSLDYLFESLGIDKVMLGGSASGTFYASSLLSPAPVLETPGLAVKDISYNRVVLGDAVVKSNWVLDTKAITLDAAIDRDGNRSFVNGAIYPLNDSLDISFTVNHTPIGFMEPYMEAFASDISGYGSGHARLWGNFKYIDLEGDVKAEDLRLKINFTNTYYTATDSVHFKPGFIDLSGITIRDANGNAAKLNGWVKHKFFKEPRFDFSVTGANDFLCYNETPRENPDWYGTIYGNGSAFVNGEPGVVNIAVDMSTAPKSVFTFVLSDREVADEYSFLTFRDKDRMMAELNDTVKLERDTSMDLVNHLRELARSTEEEGSSDYNITLQMRITPDAQIVLVMDPVGGDRIRSFGSGHLRMDYGSANNELKMYGTYTLDRGDYNFTLQDIIIKDFTIKSGSTIVFNGDPYNAQLNIEAVYALNANLSDLDESFLQDKDLNRTNVPVHALMKVSGDMRQPDIAFDLEFPTLTSDIYRKVRSIISTDDMMNRQIIYLLALNRFYTPDYMASTTKGNELVSVASSTISSQLGNILGQLSDNWNIAPTFRSDRGDFSDVEVDVALSSRLLNNRLLFNGNFGYRDKTLNSNQFIGDFDLEYLLNRTGSLRLKAYNRYNDQNYYLRSAQTTQGVGVVWRKDFDNFDSFLRRLFRRKPKGTPPADDGDKPSAPPSVPDPAAVKPEGVGTSGEGGDDDWLILK